MLDQNELAQVRHEVLTDLAAVDAATHNHHGSYTHLCAIDDEITYTHQPCGRVLHQFPTEDT